MFHPIDKKNNAKISLAALILFGIAFLLSGCSAPVAWLKFNDDTALHQISIDGNTIAEILKNAGYALGDGDLVLVNGARTDAAQEIELQNGDTIQVQRVYPLTVDDNGKQFTFLTSARTLAQALWENHILVSDNDLVSLPLDTVIDQSLSVVIQRSNTITIQVDGKQITSSTSAKTVGDALAQAGISLQNLTTAYQPKGMPCPKMASFRWCE